MKISGRKLLFLLSSGTNEQAISLPSAIAEWLLPNLSAAGRRSLIHLYQRQGLVVLERLGPDTRLRLTSDGFSVLSSVMPFYKVAPDWDGHWEAVIFGQPPSSDREFRYLRQALLKKGAASLSRGVYLYPGTLPAQLLEECQTRYAGRLTIVSVGKWLQGDVRTFINEQYAVIDVVQAYSGISSDLNRLISLKKSFSSLNHQEKNRLFSLFDRLYRSASEDFGLIPYFYPHQPTALDLLSQLHTLF